MKKLNLIIFLVFALILISCNNDEPNETPVNPDNDVSFITDGVLIINEGLFGQGNGEISYYDFSTNKVSHQIFYNINNKLLGDLPYRLAVSDDVAIITVNNSNKVYIVNLHNFLLLSEYDVPSPREIVFRDLRHIYVSSLTESYLYVINSIDNSISKIYCDRPIEQIIEVNSKIYGLAWSNYYSGKANKFVMVIDLVQNQLIDSIEVGIEPQTIVYKDNYLWVLSTGGYMHEENAKISKISLDNHQIVHYWNFPNNNDYPSYLIIRNGKMYFLNNNAIQSATIDDHNILSINTLYAASSSSSLYYLMWDGDDNCFWVSDVKDYMHNGSVYKISENGELLLTIEAELVPGMICRIL
ncbi:MAG: hypothetical protein WBH58_04415 [Bacteroidales bacterium]|jgi:hypothetical protein|nr:hypothetical protein [Bacteroidales bacterium]MDI9576124.1 hypothetical protein [Bacteroidota bacterium]MDD3754830.1 hypothetical protein [Bacteroidales bacterium]MDY0400130.1 hypothetical protein [Bacteroidales bacterium]HHW60041.1 hypothetical protein [Bacteroidales bacterium]